MGPFRVLARTAPNSCRLDIPATLRVFPELNVGCLRPCLCLLHRLGDGADVGPPPPVFGADGAPRHEVQELQMRSGLPCVLVRCTFVPRSKFGSRLTN